MVSKVDIITAYDWGKNKITTGDVKFHGYERALPNDWEAESDTKIDVFWTEV